MKTVKRILLLAALLFASNTKVSADSSPVSARQVPPVAQPALEIQAETVWVNVKNQVALTKVLQVLKNPSDSAVSTDFYFPLTDKDTLVDFGISQRSETILSGASDSSQPAAVPAAFTETDDVRSLDSQPYLIGLVPGETVSVMFLYQTAPDSSKNRFRYVFPLKESSQAKGAISSFAFYADIQEESRVMEVKTEGYPIVVRGNGPKLRAYFWQNNLLPKSNIGFSYRLMQKKPESKL